jgi:hypothetical protein
MPFLFSSGSGRGEGKRGGHVHVIGVGIGSGPRKTAGIPWNRKERFSTIISNVYKRYTEILYQCKLVQQVMP